MHRTASYFLASGLFALLASLSSCPKFTYPPEKFFAAMIGGNFHAVASMVRNEPDKAKLIDTDGYSLLHLAAKNGQAELVALLVADGADVAMPAPSGHTALQLALLSGDYKSAMILVDAGADVRAVNELDGRATCLQYAAVTGPVESARLLVEKGADVNAVDAFHASALVRAARQGRPDMVKYLVSAGARLDLVDDDGDDAIMAAGKNANDLEGEIRSYLERVKRGE